MEPSGWFDSSAERVATNVAATFAFSAPAGASFEVARAPAGVINLPAPADGEGPPAQTTVGAGAVNERCQVARAINYLALVWLI